MTTFLLGRTSCRWDLIWSLPPHTNKKSGVQHLDIAERGVLGTVFGKTALQPERETLVTDAYCVSLDTVTRGDCLFPMRDFLCRRRDKQFLRKIKRHVLSR